MDNELRIAFFGTSKFSTVILDGMVNAGLAPNLIVTQPDKPQGRKLVMTESDVKVWADENNIEVIQPESLTKETPLELKENYDLFVVVAYGKMIPKEILDLPEYGALNVHPSLLPKLRGPSPIQSAILTDQKETGVTIMLLDEEMDHGPIVAQATVGVEQWPPNVELLENLLADVSSELLNETIIPWVSGDINPEEQNHEVATYCELIKKEDALIDLNFDAYKNFLKIQAFSNWPVAYFFAEKGDKKIRVKLTEVVLEKNKLNIIKVIPEGKKEMDYEDFKRGLK